jgi:signal recognition particle subunit SRP72
MSNPSAQQHAIISACDAENVDPAKVVQLCDKCPKSDAFSQHAKAIALLQQGKPANAKTILQALVDHSDASVDMVAIRFALAYAHYKIGDVKAALEVLEASQRNGASAKRDPATLNLLAQCYYNLEEYPKAADLYERMLSEELYRDDVERSELLTNLSAAYSQYDFTKCQEAARRGGDSGNVTFDGAFNAATGAIEAKDYAAARALLSQALGLCLHEHGYEANIDILGLARQCAAPGCDAKVVKTVRDAAAVLVQQAFIHFVTGDETAAAALLEPLLPLQDMLSVATYAAACVNWAALKRHSDFFDTFKRLKHVQQPSVESRLTSRQRLYVKYNTVLLLLGMGDRHNECRRLVDAMIKESPDSDLGALALTAVLAYREGGNRTGTSRAEAHFRSFMAQRGREETPATKLTLAQLALERGNVVAALERLRTSTATLASHPSAVATLAHAYATQLHDVDAAVAVLTSVAPQYEGAANEAKFLAFAADFYAAHHRHALAASAYEALLSKLPKSADKNDPERQRWLAGLVRAAARSNPDVAVKYAGELPESTKVRVDPSEAPAAGPSVAAMADVGLRRPTARATAGAVVVKPARSRAMRRPPKQAAEGQPLPALEPERWVPMKQRTYIRDLPTKRQRELRRRRAADQEEKRRVAERRKREAAAASAAASTSTTTQPSA